MKLFLQFAIALPAIVCFVCAAVLACHDKGGWGWLIFVGLIIAPIANPNATSKILAAANHEKEQGTNA